MDSNQHKALLKQEFDKRYQTKPTLFVQVAKGAGVLE